MPQRIELAPPQITDLIRRAGLDQLREETAADARERSVGQAITALDALCGLADRSGPDAVWDALAALDRAQLLAFTAFAVGELAERTDYVADGRPEV